MYIYYSISLISSYNEESLKIYARVNQKTYFMFDNSFSKFVQFMKLCKKKIFVELDRAQMTV